MLRDTVCVAMGDVEADAIDELRPKLKALFSTVRNGVSLTSALVAALVTFYASEFSHDGGRSRRSCNQ